MSEFSKQLSDLSPKQRELLLLRLKKVNSASKGDLLQAPITPQRRAGNGFPLSFAQERLWFLDQLETGNPAYNILTAIRLSGLLNMAALERSLNEIMLRHEALRTIFAVTDGQPIQVVVSNLALTFLIVNLGELSEAKRKAEVQRLVLQENHHHFDLAQGPLIRTTLLRLGEAEHVLLLTLHHIVSDGWSINVLLRELAALYSAFSTGKPSPLPALPIQYIDFAVWQRQWLRGEVLQAQLDYWQQQLVGIPAMLALPADRPRPAIQTSRGAHQSFELPANLARELRTLSRREGVTPFMTLLATFKTLLYRYSGQQDIVVGSPIVNRPRTELEGLIGSFADTLVLRTDLSRNPNFREVLGRVRKMMMDAYVHQDIPFAKIVEAVRPERSASYNPLFQVMFNFMDTSNENLKLSDVMLTPMSVETGTTDFDLFLDMVGQEDKLGGSLGYNTDLFDASTIQQMLEHFQSLIEGVVTHPDTRFSDLPLLRRQTIAVASTFTAQPLEESLAFWMQQLDIPSQVEFAPYNQMFQQLLDPSSLLSQNQNGVNVVLLRFEDWLRFEGEVNGGTVSNTYEKIERNVRDLVRALNATKAHATAPYLLCLCPASTDAGSEQLAFFQRMEELLLTELTFTEGIYLLTSSVLTTLYPVSTYYDLHTDTLGHIPFTPTFFSALGTVIARVIYAFRNGSRRVIVLNCDRLLWQNAGRVNGPPEIEISPAQLALQKLLVAQHKAGKLICLYGKQAEEDVVQILEQHPEIQIKRSHIASWQLNNKVTPEKIKSLAKDLRLDFENFLFVTDDAVECAKVQAAYPEVLVLQVPLEHSNIVHFLKHCWAFDYLKPDQENEKNSSPHEQARRHLIEIMASTSPHLFGTLLKTDKRSVEESRSDSRFVAKSKQTSALLTRIAAQLSDVAQILTMIETSKHAYSDGKREHLFTAPRTEAEKLIAQLWAKALHLDDISIYDSFFKLGGHSLLAVQLISQLRDRFKVDLSLASFFEKPTIAGLAERIEGPSRAEQSPSLPPISPILRSGDLPLSFAEQRLWILNQLEPGNSLLHMFFALRLEGPLNMAALEKAINEIVKRHEVLRTVFVMADGQLRRRIFQTLHLILHVEDLRDVLQREREASARRLCHEYIQQPFDLANGPLLCMRLVRIGEEDHIFLITIHHIIFDDWSWDVLFQEMAAFYEAFSNENYLLLPELPLQYADFAAWQRQWLQGEALKAHLNYWKQQLADVPSFLALPTDYPRPPIQTSRGGSQAWKISQTLTQALMRLSRQEGVTLFTTLLAAFNALLFKYTLQEDIVIGIPIANRNHSEVAGLIGCFADILAIRTDLSSNPSFRQLLDRVRKVLIETYAHQDVPFLKVVEVIQPERNTSYHPIFQVMFNFIETQESQLELSGLRLTPVEMESKTAEFDLFFAVLGREEGLQGLLEYNADLFTTQTVNRLLRNFENLLQEVVQYPDRSIAHLPPSITEGHDQAMTTSVFDLSPLVLKEADEPMHIDSKQSARILPIVVTSTYTSDPLAEPLSFWLEELGMQSTIHFAPYGQVFQQLLDPTSLTARNREGVNLILLRLEDWAGPKAATAARCQNIERSVHEFIKALTALSYSIQALHLVCICPPSDSTDGLKDFLQEMSDRLSSELVSINGCMCLHGAQIISKYRVVNIYDPFSDEAGHIPYTSEFFTAMGTAIVRKLSALPKFSPRVIVLDCDGTLWAGEYRGGVINSFQLTEAHRRLQAFMLEQTELGRRLCLCSKSSESDVMEAFKYHPEMPLGLDHFDAWRLALDAVSEGLTSLAGELQVPLEELVYVSSDPSACMEASAYSQKILTLQLPIEPQGIPSFLEHVWIFDGLDDAGREKHDILSKAKV